MDVGDLLDHAGFDGTLGLFLRMEAASEMEVVGHVIFGEDDDLAGEVVAAGVERGGAFALLSARASGLLSVFAICLCAGLGLL